MRAKLYVGHHFIGECDVNAARLDDKAVKLAPGERFTVVLFAEHRRIDEQPLFVSGLLETL